MAASDDQPKSSPAAMATELSDEQSKTSLATMETELSDDQPKSTSAAMATEHIDVKISWLKDEWYVKEPNARQQIERDAIRVAEDIRELGVDTLHVNIR